MQIRLKRSLLVNEHKNFVVDHPFIFFIVTQSNNIVFVGRMAKIDPLVINLVKEEL